MFPHCLFEHRLRTRNIKEANQQAWEAFREITQRRGIYKKTSFSPSWTLKRTLATFSSLLSRENIQKRGKDIFNVESSNVGQKQRKVSFKDISQVWGHQEHTEGLFWENTLENWYLFSVFLESCSFNLICNIHKLHHIICPHFLHESCSRTFISKYHL